MTLRTCDSSVRAIAAICDADMPVEDANKMIARWRLDWYLAFLEIDFSRAPSSGESARTNTSGGRIATSILVIRPSSPRTASFRSNVHRRPTSSRLEKHGFEVRFAAIVEAPWQAPSETELE